MARTDNTAADAVLGEVLRRGSHSERCAAAESLLARDVTAAGYELVRACPDLPADLTDRLLANTHRLVSAVSKCCRSSDESARVGAARFIGMTGGHADAGRLASLLASYYESRSPRVFNEAAAAVLKLSKWVHETSQQLREDTDLTGDQGVPEVALGVWKQLCGTRSACESVVTIGLDTTRGGEHLDLASSAVYLASSLRPDGRLAEMLRRPTTPWPAVNRLLTQSRDGDLVVTLRGVMNFPGRGRLKMPRSLPSELRSQAVGVLKGASHRLVTPGVQSAVWQNEAVEGVGAGVDRLRWILASGQCPHAVGNGLLKIKDKPLTRLRTMRQLRKHDALSIDMAVELAASLDADPSPRVTRMVMRELGRLARDGQAAGVASADIAKAERAVLQSAGRVEPIAAVTRIVRRSFDRLCQRYDKLLPDSRVAAVRGLMKLLPNKVEVLAREMSRPQADACLRGMQLARDADLLVEVGPQVLANCRSQDARVRSKAVLLLKNLVDAGDAKLASDASEALGAGLNDSDARVRANAIEVLDYLGMPGEHAQQPDAYVGDLLVTRSRQGSPRERANAIRALTRFDDHDARHQADEFVLDMLRSEDDRSRLSGIWAAGHVVEREATRPVVETLTRMIKVDPSHRIRRSAFAVVSQLARKREATNVGSATRPLQEAA